MEFKHQVRQQVIRSCHSLLRPIVALMLRSGITWKEFADVARNVFVNVATDDYGRKGRPTNVSRVAILTGLSRRDVTRLRKTTEGDADSAADAQINDAARVLSGWHQDAEFVDAKGNPQTLPRNGIHPSFESLLKRYAGDIPPVALFKELLSVNALRENENGTVDALSRYYMPVPLDVNAVLRAGSVWQDLGETINYNLTRADEGPSRFEGRATNRKLSRSAVAAFYRMIEEKAETLLEETDQWLSDNEADDESDGIRAGIGIYLIDDSRSK